MSVNSIQTMKVSCSGLPAAFRFNTLSIPATGAEEDAMRMLKREPLESQALQIKGRQALEVGCCLRALQSKQAPIL